MMDLQARFRANGRSHTAPSSSFLLGTGGSNSPRRPEPPKEDPDVSAKLREEQRLCDERLRGTIPKGLALIGELEKEVAAKKASGEKAPWLGAMKRKEIEGHLCKFNAGVIRWKLEVRVMDASKKEATLIHKRGFSASIDSLQKDLVLAEELQMRTEKLLVDCLGERK